MKANKRFNLLVLMVLSFLSTVGLSLAYWASSVLGTTSSNGETITIGEGDIIETEVTLNSESSGGYLVPSGRANDEGEVESITLTYEVSFISADSLNRGAEGTEGTLQVSVENITFNGSPNQDLESLIHIELPIDETIFADGDSVIVSVTITMDEPTSETIYNLIANSEVSMTLVFTVSV